MKYKVIVYYDNMEDSEQVFSNKNDAINEMHRLGVKYRNARKYKVEMVECDGWFYGGTLADYIRYCDDRYSGKFKLKKHEDIFDGFSRWLKNEGVEEIDD